MRLDRHGLEDDCPVFTELPSYARAVVGASLAAAQELRDGRADIAICWDGGRHHAMRDKASGFCYVNDVVLAIQELRRPSPIERRLDPSSRPKRINRVLYLDFDVHHGDGVESAFFVTPSVLTLSVHLHSRGFFPSATGSLDSIGPSPPNPAAYHALNLALSYGLSSANLARLFDSCIVPIKEAYNPDAVVAQLGCDGLSGDPCKAWNLDLKGIGEITRSIIEGWKLRTLLLGGGGYDSPNAARCWAYLTSVALGRPLPLSQSIPFHDFYPEYSPSFTLDVPKLPGMKDENTEEVLEQVESAFKKYQEELKKKYIPKGKQR